MGKLFNWAINWNTRCFMQRFQDEIDIVFTFKTFDQQDLLGSLQKQTKVAKKLQKYFHDSSNFAFCRVFLPGCIAVTNTPRSSPLSPIIKHYQPQQCVLFLHKKQGGSNKTMPCNSFSKNKRIWFSYLLLSLWSAWRMFFAFILYKQFCLTYYNLLLTHTRK